MKTLKEHIELQEANLSRVLKHMENHDTGGITAWRSARDCGKGEPYTRKENDVRNKNLLAKLTSRGYGVIRTRGEYPEGGDSIVGENSFFVFDKNNTGNLKKDLITLGKDNDQDSILFIAKGSKDGILIGTNHCPNNDIPFGKEINIGKRFMGKKGKYGTSKSGTRPWAFGDIAEEVIPPASGMGVWARNHLASLSWEEHMKVEESWENDNV